MATFSDAFTRADGAIGADYETPPEDQISDQVDAIDFAIVSNGLECANDTNPNPNHLYGTARLLTAIPGDQQITLTVSNLDDCGFSGTIEIYAHMNGTDAACRVGSWSTFDPPPAAMYDYDSAGTTSADFSNFLDPASSLATTTELRLVSKTNGEWEIWTNGALVDSGTEPGVAVGDYVGFGLRWFQSGADSSPRIEAFEAETIAAPGDPVPLSDLVDDFSGTLGQWTTGASGATIVSDHLDLPYAAATTNTIPTAGLYIATNDRLLAQVADVEIGSQFTMRLADSADATTFVEMAVDPSGLLGFRLSLEGVLSYDIAGVAFNATSHAWWQIVEADSTFTFYTSPNGADGSWLVQYTASHAPWVADSVYVEFETIGA